MSKNNSLRSKLLNSVKRMLGASNNKPAEMYGWVDEMWGNASMSDLIKLQAGWMVNQPERFASFGVYVL